MLKNYEFTFDLRPGKPVYIQRRDAKARASVAVAQIERRYTPHRIFFHMRRKGGHVAAMRLHKQSTFFSRFDITDFFGHVTRTKIARALREIGFTRQEAFSIAADAVVVRDEQKVLPFGFHQSPLLATLALERSCLGRALVDLSASGVLVSVYMDDILLSGSDQEDMRGASAAVIEAAAVAGFPLSTDKLAQAVPSVDVFNCHIRRGGITVLEPRMDRFVEDHRNASDAGQAAIERYVNAVSPSELKRLNELLRITA
jgi:hypothetical protein